ncbi:unnamed protein product [Calypogeia fissa]
MAMAGIAISAVAVAPFSGPLATIASSSKSRPKSETGRPLRNLLVNRSISKKTPHTNRRVLDLWGSPHGFSSHPGGFSSHICTANLKASEESVEQLVEEEEEQAGTSTSGEAFEDGPTETSRSKSSSIDKELNQVVMKTAATFAPRASTASKNPASPGTTLYKVFEAQAYVAMVLGGALSFNLLFPSDHPDIWRLMGMWSVWMFSVPSLRARDCSKNEKQALNYLFLAIPLINVTLPLVWKSFAAVWSADILAFFAIYAWKMEWLSGGGKVEDS